MAKLPLHQFVLFFVIQLMFVLSAAGQIKGKILDATGQPLSFCQVGLAKATDSVIVNTAITDSKGKFEMQAKDNGTFRVLASYIGYKTFYSSVFSISTDIKQYDAGNITLTPEAKTLTDVDVIAQKPFVEYKIDRTVYNIENSIIASGNNVLEVLEKLPGIKVDNNDNISVDGTSGVLIMIDGRTSYLSAADATSYLKTLDASQIEKIEVITKPSAKYDASGATIINIVRKRNQNAGLYAELTSNYEQGIYGGGDEGIDLNYNAKKWNIFANYNYSFEHLIKYFGGTTNYITNSEVQNVFVDSLQRKESNWTNNERLEADFMPDKKQTLAFVVEGFQSNGVVDKSFPNKMYGSDLSIDSSLNMQGHRTYFRRNMSYGLNYNLKLDTTGKEFSADVNYASNTTGFSELDVTSYYDSLSEGSRVPAILQYSLPRNINIWAIKLDYDQPIGKNGKLETGLKGSYVTTDNNAQYWNIINGIYSVDTAFTNDFTYKEYIYAGYVNYIQKISKRMDIQGGLRGEQTQNKGIQSVHDTSFTHNYFSLFPNLLVAYKLDTNNTLKLSYRRKIWRPSYQDLNPFVYIINPYSYQEGNPALQPQISNATSITEVYKSILTIEAGDEYWTSTISDITVQNNQTFITYNKPVNFKKFNDIYGKVEAPLPIAKWFTSMNTLLFMQQQVQGSVQGVYFTKSQFTWTYNMVNTITLNKAWSCELDFDYYSKELNGPELYNPLYIVEAGIKRNFAHNKGTITLNCSDIFWSEHYSSSEVFQSENFHTYEYYDSRRLRLSLSWKFGKSEKEQGEKNKAAQEELNRIKE